MRPIRSIAAGSSVNSRYSLPSPQPHGRGFLVLGLVAGDGDGRTRNFETNGHLRELR